jgi:hypothetical protein
MAGLDLCRGERTAAKNFARSISDLLKCGGLLQTSCRPRGDVVVMVMLAPCGGKS